MAKHSVVTIARAVLATWQLAPLLIVFGAGMGLSFTPLLPYALSQVNPQDAGSILEIGILVLCVILSFFLPRNIVPSSDKQS